MWEYMREVNGGIRHAELGASLSAALMLASLIAYSLWKPGATVKGSNQVSRTQTPRGFLTLTTLWQYINAIFLPLGRSSKQYRSKNVLKRFKMMKLLHLLCSENSHCNVDLHWKTKLGKVAEQQTQRINMFCFLLFQLINRTQSSLASSVIGLY